MQEITDCSTGGCGCSPAAQQNTEEFNFENMTASQKKSRQLDIEFLYLDLDVCQPCRGTESNLDEALADIAEMLEKTGVEVDLKKIHVESYEQALSLGFVSSPTIRVGGRDVQLEVKENHCATCSQLSGKNTDCRVWVYRGQEYSAAPRAMIIEAVLEHIYGGSQNSNDTVFATARDTNRPLENLRQFFEDRKPNSETDSVAAGTTCGC